MCLRVAATTLRPRWALPRTTWRLARPAPAALATITATTTATTAATTMATAATATVATSTAAATTAAAATAGTTTWAGERLPPLHQLRGALPQRLLDVLVLGRRMHPLADACVGCGGTSSVVWEQRWGG